MKRLWILIMLVFMCVSPVYAADVTLTWDAPTTNTNESCIDDLAGYKVHYGPSTGDYTTIADIGNIACIDSGEDAGTGCGNIYACSYTVTNLVDGNWFFAITAHDTAGNESVLSNECNKIIDSI